MTKYGKDLFLTKAIAPASVAALQGSCLQAGNHPWIPEHLKVWSRWQQRLTGRRTAGSLTGSCMVSLTTRVLINVFSKKTDVRSILLSWVERAWFLNECSNFFETVFSWIKWKGSFELSHKVKWICEEDLTHCKEPSKSLLLLFLPQPPKTSTPKGIKIELKHDGPGLVSANGTSRPVWLGTQGFAAPCNPVTWEQTE